MMMVNNDKKFADAVSEKCIDKVESLLLCSDSKCEMMKNFSQSNDVNSLLCLLCEFKSKGLVVNIENLCEQHDNFKSFYTRTKKISSGKIVLEHRANKISNKEKHLSGSSFDKKVNSSVILINESIKKGDLTDCYVPLNAKGN